MSLHNNKLVYMYVFEELKCGETVVLLEKKESIFLFVPSIPISQA